MAVTRRTFLERTAATAVLAAAGPLAGRGAIGATGDGQTGAAAGPGAAPRRLWAAGWLLWRDFTPRTITLAEALRDLQAAGCDGIEFTPRPGELQAAGLTVDRVTGLLRDHGLRVAGHYFSAPFDEPGRQAEILAAAQEKFDSLRAFGARHLVIGPPMAPPGGDRAERIARMAPVLAEVGRRARELGLLVGVHPHLNTLIETPEDTALAMARFDPALVGLALDTGHFHLAGGDVPTAVRTHATRLSYLHFKDAVRPFARPDFFPNLRELGRGEVDFPATMRALDDVGYAGWINVEQDVTTTTPAESIRTSMQYVREALGRPPAAGR